MNSIDGVRVTVLDNGLRVATDAMPSVETVSVGVWAEVGTRHEPPEINGVSHLLEHMAFKGTEKRSARAIAEEIEAVGGHLNAYTSRENTAYYAKLLAEDLPLGLDIIADILQHSVFDPEELARERAVVLQEIGQAEDTPDDIIFDRFQETAFPDQAIGRTGRVSSECHSAMLDVVLDERESSQGKARGRERQVARRRRLEDFARKRHNRGDGYAGDQPGKQRLVPNPEAEDEETEREPLSAFLLVKAHQR